MLADTATLTDTTLTDTTLTDTGLVDLPGDGCARCAYSHEHGWWGPGSKSHCRDCHYEWNSLNEAHCAACHRHFSSSRGFDYHQIGEDCCDPDELARQDGKPRFVRVENADGRVVWHAPRYDKRTRPWSDQQTDADEADEAGEADEAA